MVKKIIIGVVVLGVILLAGWKLFLSGSDVSGDFNKIKDSLTSYSMEATMELNQNEEKKNYFVKVDYLKKDDQPLFRISLLDNDIKQEQILIRNQKGVYVLTPMLNQVYQFKGDYPLNSPKPYLYHSMLDAFDGEHELKSMSDGYLLSFAPKYNHQKDWSKEDIKFSKDYKPLWVNIYDTNSSLVAAIIFSKVEINPTLNESLFDVETNMKQARENDSSKTQSIEDLPFLPVSNNFNASLTSNVQGNVNDEVSFILTYDGDKDYRVIQHLITPSEEMEYINESQSEYVDVLFGIGFYKNNYFTYISGNVCYEVYSLDLQVTEMVDVVYSMDISSNK